MKILISESETDGVCQRDFALFGEMLRKWHQLSVHTEDTKNSYIHNIFLIDPHLFKLSSDFVEWIHICFSLQVNQQAVGGLRQADQRRVGQSQDGNK